MAERRLARDVRHRRAEEVRVGHLRRCEIVHANEDGASKVDLADDALVRGIVGSDPIADGEGTVQDDDERSQDVRGGVSEGEGHEKRADGGEGCEDVHVRVPHAEEPSEEEVREERLERSAIEQRGGRARTPRHAGQHRGIVRVPRPQFLLLASLPAPAFPLPLDAFALRLAHPLLRFLDVAIQRALILGEFPRAFIQPLRAFVPRGVRGVDHLRVHAGRARTLRAGAGAGRDGPAGRGGRGGRGGRRPGAAPGDRSTTLRLRVARRGYLLAQRHLFLGERRAHLDDPHRAFLELALCLAVERHFDVVALRRGFPAPSETSRSGGAAFGVVEAALVRGFGVGFVRRRGGWTAQRAVQLANLDGIRSSGDGAVRVAHDEDEGQVHHAEDELETHDDHRGVDELLDPGA